MGKIFHKLIDAAKEASKNSYSPYSRFAVGAAVLTADGKIFTGTNVENSSFGLTVCAERVAILKAVSEGKKKFKAIAVASQGKNFAYPCGACLQVMSEFSKDLDVIVVCGNKFKVVKLQELIPFAFKLEK